MTSTSMLHRVAGITNGAFRERAHSDRPLPLAMSIRVNHKRVGLERRALAAAYPAATGEVAVFVHGLSDTERTWFRSGEADARSDFGSRLAEDLGATPVYVRYNTGRHVAQNGRELAALLTDLIKHWPTKVTGLVLIGHSMGGLVALEALRHTSRKTPWRTATTRVVCLGTPHTGAPLERAVARAATALTRSVVGTPIAWLLALRSNGIKDLAHGRASELLTTTMDSHSRKPAAGTALPAGLKVLYVTATLSRTQGSIGARALGDLMVRPSSAGHLSHNADQRWLGGLNHFDLLRHDDVYQVLVEWLRAITGQDDAVV